jgi:DeoR family transcriptional regulator, suf operon transcriptional repressor
MTATGPQLQAHKGLRREVLLELKRAQPRTAKQLAATLGVSVNAVRHHLKELQAEALVAYGREQRGVGAPTFAYRLSAAGEALFPRAYEETLTQLLERVAEKGGRGAAVELFEDHYRELASKLAVELEGAPQSQRVALVARLMNDQGYMAEWREAAGVFQLAEHNCAIRAVAERFPEVCAAEEKFLREVLGAAVERRTHIASGCNACEYAITFGPSGPSGPSGPVGPSDSGPSLECA